MNSCYSISELLKNVYSLIMTKLFFRQARLLRRPIYIRGKKSIVGAVRLTTGYACRFDLAGTKETLFIGQDCQFGDNTHIVAMKSVIIGNNVLLASNVFISDTNHGAYKGYRQSSPLETPDSRELHFNNVVIGDNVWLGQNVIVLAGSKIGSGSIVGANSVVTGDIPENSIVVGNNRVIKRYCADDHVWKLV